MKPNFALTLSFEGIGLLHRIHAGWHLVGEVGLDSPDLNADLAALAAKARSLDPTGLRSKLVIPEEQIKYLGFDSDAQDVDVIERKVREALDGATPYALDELSYDWSVRAGRVHVAAVARETLAEAEDFAVEHGFTPLCFVSIPAGDAFAGEPFFGETRHAAKVLGPDETVMHENEVIHIIGAAHLPEPDPVIKEDAPPPAAPEPAHEEDATAPAEEAAPPPTESEPLVVEYAPPPATQDAPTDGTALPSTGFTPKEDAPPPDEPEPAPVWAAQADLSENPVPDDRQNSEQSDDASDGKPAQDTTGSAAFTSTRTGAPGVSTGPAPRLSGVTRTPELPEVRFTSPPVPSEVPDTRVEPPKTAGIADAALPEADPGGKTAKPQRPPEPAPVQSGPDLPAPALEDPAAESVPQEGGISHRRTRDGTGKRKAKSRYRDSPPKTTVPAGAATLPAADPALDEAQRLTVFGARQAAAAEPDKPRYLALALTAILLLALVAVAVWASLFLEDGLSRFFRAPDKIQVAEPQGGTGGTDTEAPIPDAEATAPETETASGAGPDPATKPEESAEDVIIASLPDEGDETAQTTARPDPVPEELSPDEARARYAVTGIWQMAPEPSNAPDATTLEEVYQTTLEAPVDFSDAVALPEAGEYQFEPRPTTPAPPPPPGTRFTLDARGFIAATPDGTETPDGVVVYAGAPPVAPPPTPPRTAPDLSDTPEAAAPAEPALRPRLRPDNLTETYERNTLGGRTRTELGTLRPKLRPRSAQELAAEEAGTEPGIDGETPLAGATEEAVAASLKPRTRPARFAAIVEEIREAAAAAPVSADQRVAVTVPTSVSVARAATEKNQVSLRKVNLIGVYGKTGSRRALVRLANGRYQKVQVGDRLDGGQVAAIGADELRYVKRGRSVVLRMPSG